MCLTLTITRILCCYRCRYGTRTVTVVLRFKDVATYYCYRSFDPEASQEVAPAQVAPTSAAAGYSGSVADEVELGSLARAESQALRTGVGSDRQFVPVGTAPHKPHTQQKITVAGLEWVLFRAPL